MEKNEAMTMSSPASRPGLLAPLAAAVRSGALPALRLAEESLRRIEAARDLNAVVAVRPAAALADAEHLDAAVRGGADPGPLAGLPLLVKDIEDAAGLPTTFGSLLRPAQAAARCDGVVARRLRRRGGDPRGQDECPGVRVRGLHGQPTFRGDQEPMGARILTRRIVGWFRGGTRRRFGAARDGHRRRWIRPNPGGTVRTRRPEANIWPHRARPGAGQPRSERPRATGSDRGRHSAA